MRSGRPAPQADDDGGSGGMALYLGLAALVLALAGGAFVFWPGGDDATADVPDTPAEAATTVPLSLDTQPGDATVTVNGESAGVAPLRSYRVAAGEVRVQLERDGYAPLDTLLTARAGEALDYDLRMRPLASADAAADAPSDASSGADATASADPAPTPDPPPTTDEPTTQQPTKPPPTTTAAPRLTVTSEPSGAKVYVGDRLLGTTPLRGYELDRAGNVTIDVVRAGFVQKRVRERVAAGQTRTVSVSLEPAAVLRLDSPVSGVTVRVDGRDFGEAGGTFDLEPGTHEIQFTHPRYGSADTTLTVGPSQQRELTCYFEQQVVVNMGGGMWGNVILNGSNTQESTPHKFTLGPGTHRVGVNIARKDVVIQGGVHRVRTGNRDQQDTFVGDTRTITVRPSFEPRSHALVFNTSQ
jgi:hypothetical protein